MMRRKGVGAGVVVTSATAGVIFAWLFRGAPVPDGVQPEPPVQMEIDLLAQWAVHVIVAGGNGAGQPDGADGLPLPMMDLDGDGLLDTATGHEQGLRVTLSFNPGPASSESLWPTVTLPSVNMCSPEDAQFADVDADGAIDIIAGCETGTSTIEIFFAPSPPNTRAELLVAANWSRVQVTTATQRSMRVIPHDLVGDDSLELVVGGKESSCGTPPIGEADIGYYTSETPRTGSSWVFTPIVPAGWTQQMYVLDFDGDTDDDIVYSDFERIDCPAIDNSRRGVRWLELDASAALVEEHQISVLEGNHRWFSLYDADGDGDQDVLDCESLSGPPPVSELQWLINGGGGESWTSTPIPTQTTVGSCIHVIVADFDKDSAPDIAVSYSHADAASGVIWLKRAGATIAGATYERGEVSGILDLDSDVKFDNLVALDVDGDEDLDLITTEQHVPAGTGPGLGVVWLENPLAPVDPGVGDDDAPPDDGDDVPPDDGVDDGGGGAIVCSALTSGTGLANTQAVTSSVTPTANAVVYAAFLSSLASEPDAPTTVTGNGLTYVQEETVAWHNEGDRRMTVFRAQGASPSAGALTATWAESQTSFQWVVIECTGASTAGTNGSGATVQSVTTTAIAVLTHTNTLAALVNASSVHLAFWGLNVIGPIAPDADFVELAETSIGTGAANLHVEWAEGDLPVTPTWPASANVGGISIEVRTP